MDAEVLTEVRRLFADEEGTLATARSRAGDAVAPPSPEVGSLLRWVATSTEARAAVEVGSAGGVSALWLLRGLGPRGAVTSIEPDPHAHGLATSAYADADMNTHVRAILGQPDAVLPRLSDGAYDLMLLQSASAASVANLEHARRLLRPGGALIARGVLQGGERADGLARFLDELAGDDAFSATVLPLDGGVALATHTGESDNDGGN